MGFSHWYFPDQLKTGPFENQTFCPDFEWFLIKLQPFVWISNDGDSVFLDPTQNLDHLQANLISIIQNHDASRFQIHTVFFVSQFILFTFSVFHCPPDLWWSWTVRCLCLLPNVVRLRSWHKSTFSTRRRRRHLSNLSSKMHREINSILPTVVGSLL